MSTPSKRTQTSAATNVVRPARVFRALPVEEISQVPNRPKTMKKLISSMSSSMALHLIVLFALSLVYFDLPKRTLLDSILWLTGTGNELATDNVVLDSRGSPEPKVEFGGAKELTESPDQAIAFAPATIDLQPVPLNPASIQAPGRQRSDKGVTSGSKPASGKVSTTGASTGKSKTTGNNGTDNDDEVVHPDHFVGRSPMAKMALLKRMGGTDASEAAVGQGLVWLKNHQLPDGSWNFYHLHDPRCDCSMPGRLDNNPNAATAMALLAFLGAGHTHETGEYKSEVQQGLDFLLSNGSRAERGICFYGQLSGPQTYYTHGLVTIALGEAFAMTNDAGLRPFVTGAVDFLTTTQEAGGGWRYFPGQPGDTSVVAWQLMGLKSAQFSRIAVPQKVFKGIDKFMRSVSSMRGSKYAYTPERKDTPTYSMTAAGLLCRMYLDWDDTNGGMRAGIRVLDEHGPEPDGMYYNYYATQVMHHWGGPEWDRWNNVMREHLIRTQIREGHATGSWDVADRHGNIGGRLYMTTLALLTLEVYYRHLPLYQKDRIEIPLINQAAEVAQPRDPKIP